MNTTTTEILTVRVIMFPDDTADAGWSRAVRIADRASEGDKFRGIFDGLSIRRDNRAGEWVCKFRMITK